VNWIDKLWWSVGGIVAIAGLVILARALFADRARGRQRCPKCWYDLTESPTLRCSECGHEARRAEQTRRTRRHWRGAAAGLMLIVLPLGTLSGWEVYKHGSWVAAAPTAGYIAFLPRLDDQTTLAELKRRVNEGELRQREYRFLVRRCIGLLRDHNRDDQLLITVARLLIDIEQFERGRMTRAERQPWKSWSSVSEIDPDGAVEVLGKLLEHSNRTLQAVALDGLGRIGAPSTRALPAIVPKLYDDDREVRRLAQQACTLISWDRFDGAYSFFVSRGPPDMAIEGDFYRRLSACGTDYPKALPIVLEGLERETPRTRSEAMFLGSVLFHDHPVWRERVLEHAENPESPLHYHAVVATMLFPLDERVQRIVREALADDDPRKARQEAGMKAIKHRGSEAAIFQFNVEAILQDSTNDFVLAQAVECYLRIGGAVAIALEPLVMWSDESFDRNIELGIDWEIRFAFALRALAERMDFTEEDKCIVAEYMDHESIWVRGAAAYCYAAIGGDRSEATRVALDLLTVGRTGQAAREMASKKLLDAALVGELLYSTNSHHQRTAIELLHEMGEAAASELPALRALAVMGNPRAEEVVRFIEFVINRDQ
jgi:hypothetical protein